MRFSSSHPPSNCAWRTYPFFCIALPTQPKLDFYCGKPNCDITSKTKLLLISSSKYVDLAFSFSNRSPPLSKMTSRRILRLCNRFDRSCFQAAAAWLDPSTGLSQVHLPTSGTTPFLHLGRRTLAFYSLLLPLFSRQDSIIATKSEPDRASLLAPSHLAPSKPGGTHIGVEQDLAILQEFLIPGVLWGYLECIHFPEITNSRSSWNEPVSWFRFRSTPS